MGRNAKPWQRKDRSGWWSKLDGKFVRLGKTEREAWAALNRILSTRAQGPVKARITTQELIDLWLDATKSTVKPVSWIQYQKYGQSFINHCGRVVASELKPLHVSGWLKAHPTWQGCKRLAVSVAKLATRWGRREGWLDVDPLADVRTPPIRARSPAPDGAFEGMEAGIRSERFREILAFLLATGCRPGEARTLEASSVDLAARIALVRGKTGERPVVLPTAILGLVARLCQEHPTGAIFRNTYGRPWAESTLRGHWWSVRKRAGVKDVCSYHCRGDFASRVYAAGADGVTVAKLLGHRDTSRLAVLIRHYLSVDAEKLSAAVERAATSSSAAPAPTPRDTTQGKPPSRSQRSSRDRP